MAPTDKSLIDCHVHLAALPDGHNGCYISPRMLKSPLFRFLFWKHGLSVDRPREGNEKYLEDLLLELRASRHVQKAVLLGMDGHYDSSGALSLEHTDLLVTNDYVLKAARAHPDELLTGVSINPQRRDALDEVHRCADAGATLVKVLPNAQQFDPADPKYKPFYRALAERSGVAAGCVRLVHTQGSEPLPIEKHCRQSLDPSSIGFMKHHRDTICEISRLALDGRFRRRCLLGDDRSQLGELADIDWTQQELRSCAQVATACFMAATALTEMTGYNNIFAMMEVFLPKLLAQSGLHFERAGKQVVTTACEQRTSSPRSPRSSTCGPRSRTCTSTSTGTSSGPSPRSGTSADIPSIS